MRQEGKKTDSDRREAEKIERQGKGWLKIGKHAWNKNEKGRESQGGGGNCSGNRRHFQLIKSETRNS